MPAPLKESDLYAPIKALLTSQGFTVRGEVKGCDLAAVRDDELYVVELKLGFTLHLVYQAMARQEITPLVFVAIPRPRDPKSKNFRAAQKLLQRLSLGLIVVAGNHAEILLHPAPAKPKNNKKTRAVRQEVAERTVDTDGGVTQTKINTAFRERNIRIACLLAKHGTRTVQELRTLHGCDNRTSGILRRNIYGWFAKTDRSHHTLSATGYAYLTAEKDSDLVRYYIGKA